MRNQGSHTEVGGIVAFLALPRVPHFKITDRALVDVDRMKFVRD